MPQTVKENNKPFTAVIISCILFGMIGIFVKDIKNMEVGSILFYRLFFGFAAILAYLAVTGKLEKLQLKQKKHYILLLGVLNTVTMFSYFSAIKHTSIPVAVLLLYTAPIYVTLLSPFILKERVTLRSMFALTLSLSGIVLAVDPAGLMGSPGSAGVQGSYIAGMFFGLLSGLSYGCSIMTVNYLKETYSAVEQMLWSTGVSLVLLLPFGISVPGPVLLDNLGMLIPFGVIATAFGSLLYLSGVAHIKAQTAAVLSLLEPVSSICFGCTVLGEPIQANTIGGCLFILAGAFLVGRSTPRRPRIISGKYFRGIQARLFQPFMPPRPGKL
ncbi:EamA family transporter [Methanosarcina sp. KYL-1]|uniref:DMT family transporter n=1 Tax=Methanosarcina sp. KYL-1 TaxID=2602068 RepID=UPI0021016098|nr:DMT family transporter [Methanosarcina sp. KYL-1]MCQ1536432.1 EamA family transporter [Methanosarcina sp. KYL-1]